MESQPATEEKRTEGEKGITRGKGTILHERHNTLVHIAHRSVRTPIGPFSVRLSDMQGDTDSTVPKPTGTDPSTSIFRTRCHRPYSHDSSGAEGRRVRYCAPRPSNFHGGDYSSPRLCVLRRYSIVQRTRRARAIGCGCDPEGGRVHAEHGSG